jgi:trimeric autotransporter adhesin
MKARFGILLLIGLLAAAAAVIVAGIARRSGGEMPDLAARSLQIPKPLPPAVRAGSSVTVEVAYAEIAGVALDASVAFDIVAFLSIDARIETRDIAIGKARIEAGAAPGKDFRQRLTVTVPETTAPGTFYLGAIVDAGNEVAEPAEDNNATGPNDVARVKVLPAALSKDVYDLFLGGSAWTGLCYDFEDQRFEAAPGARLYAEAQPVNLGGLVPEAYELAFYASKDQTITSDDALLGKVAVKPAGTPTASAAPRLSLVVPELEANETYYCGALIDSTDALKEADETNNVSTLAEFTVVARAEAAVDLSVPECELPDVSQIEAGQVHHLPHAVAAFGSINPGAFAVGYFLDSNGDGRIETDGEDLEIGRKLFPGGMDLDSHPDAVGVGFATVEVPAGAVAPGAYRVGVVIDPDNSVSEKDETNNSCISPDKVTVTNAETAPDLVVALTDADAYVFEGKIRAQVGASVPIPFTLLANRGARAVQGPVAISYFLSADAAVDTPGDDKAVGSHVVPAGVGAGLRQVFKGVSVELKALSAGDYFLFAIVDRAAEVVEQDESNNDSATADLGDGPAGFIEVVVSPAPPLPDLAVISMEDFPHHLYAGSDSRVSAYCEVVNASTGSAAGPSVASLWVSTNGDPRIGEDDVHLDSAFFGFLAPFATGGGEFYVKTGFDPVKGATHHLKLVVDSLNEVDEADEENNTWVSSPFTFQ